MRLGVSYNVFDAEELLEGSIKCIRDSVDYISIVYQKVSNHGNKCDVTLLKTIKELFDKKLIDGVYEYIPDFNIPLHQHEVNKRNIGLQLSINAGCTHHMSMDTDEYYIKSEFDNFKKVMIEGDYDSSFCKMISYYKTTEYVRDPLEDYHLSLIYKIKPNIKYIYAYPTPVEIDPSRRMVSGNFKIFERDELQMHHLSMVRKNLNSKLENSSAKHLFNNNILELIDCYNNWEYPNDALWPGNPSYNVKIKKVKNIF